MGLCDSAKGSHFRGGSGIKSDNNRKCSHAINLLFWSIATMNCELVGLERFFVTSYLLVVRLFNCIVLIGYNFTLYTVDSEGGSYYTGRSSIC